MFMLSRTMSSTSNDPRLIVIDGPAGAGKSTVARRLAQIYALPLLDTGALYRVLAYIANERQLSWEDEEGLVALLQDFPIRFEAPGSPGEAQRVLFAGRNLTQLIRTPEISEGASKVSALGGVRDELLSVQRELAHAGCVAEGRDMGTVVFPDAPYKFFLTASAQERSKRRYEELKQRGSSITQEQVLQEIEERDFRDSNRELAPLKPAADAIEIDSSAIGIDDVIKGIREVIDGSSSEGIAD